MKKFIKEHWLLTSILFVALTASAAKIGEDLLKIGKPGSTSDKQIVFDVGDGATNPSITIDFTNKDFTFNKALKITEDLLQVGDGTNTDKDIVFDIGNGATNPRFRWDSTNNVILFSQDGSSFKKIGSGSGSGGGGTNVLADNNADFETGTPPTDWTASGGTFIAETSTPLFGAASGSWDASALSQTLDSVLAPITTGFLGNTCQAEIDYIYASGAAGDYKMVVRQYDDSGATEITVAEIDLEVTTTKKKAQLYFDCPDDVADDLRVRIEAGVADPGIILIDDAFIGTGRNTFQLSQTELVAMAHYVGTGGCTWSLTSGGFADFPANSACPAITVVSSTQAINTADNDLPDLVFDNLAPGKYVVEATFPNHATNSNVDYGYRITDGTTFQSGCGSGTGTTAEATFPFPHATCKLVVEYTAAGARTFKVQAFAGSGAAEIKSDQGMSRELVWQVTKYPTTSAEAITMLTSGWHVDANIGGSDVSLGVGNVATYSPMANSSLDMVINSGSQPALIPCAGGSEESSGLTCSVNSEHVGISFDAPSAGRYKVCGAFSHAIQVNAVSDYVESVFQWVETPNSGETILQEGNERISHAFGINAGAGDDRTDSAPYNLCGEFYFASPGKKTLRLMYEQLIGGAPLASVINASRGAGQGQRDIHIKVEKMSEQKPTPIFTDLQSDFGKRAVFEGETNLKSCALDYSAGIVQNIGGCVSSVSNPATGAYTVLFNGGTWPSVKPVCNCTVYTGDGVGRRTCAFFSGQYDTTQAQVKITSETGAAINDSFLLNCVGVQ